LAGGLDVVEGDAHTGVELDVDDRPFGFEIFAGVEDFYEDGSFDVEGRGHLEIAAAQAEFGGASVHGGIGRSRGSDLGSGIEYEPEGATIGIHDLSVMHGRGVWRWFAQGVSRIK